jgi:hypothetical protein
MVGLKSATRKFHWECARVLEFNNDVSHRDNRQRSPNWAGAILSASGFTQVSATFTVPTPEIPSGGDGRTQYCASAWIGIDGVSCHDTLLQTGLDFCVQGSSVTYQAWYEWIPAGSVYFNGINFKAGDSVSISVHASSTTTGTATITNRSNGQTVTHTFTSAETTSTLCETNAEWIVEDFTIVSPTGSESLAPFPKFSSVTFTNAYAVKNGKKVDASGASTATLVDSDGKTLASPSVDGSTVTITYV